MLGQWDVGLIAKNAKSQLFPSTTGKGNYSDFQVWFVHPLDLASMTALASNMNTYPLFQSFEIVSWIGDVETIWVNKIGDIEFSNYF